MRGGWGGPGRCWASVGQVLGSASHLEFTARGLSSNVETPVSPAWGRWGGCGSPHTPHPRACPGDPAAACPRGEGAFFAWVMRVPRTAGAALLDPRHKGEDEGWLGGFGEVFGKYWAVPAAWNLRHVAVGQMLKLRFPRLGREMRWVRLPHTPHPRACPGDPAAARLRGEEHSLLGHESPSRRRRGAAGSPPQGRG